MRLFDLHCDTLYECVIRSENLDKNNLAVSLEKGDIYSPWIQCYAAWIPDNLRGENAWKLFKKCAGIFENEKKLFHIKNRLDLLKANYNGLKSGILTVESGAPARGTINGIDELFSNGVRMMTLTWNGSNELGDGSSVKNAKGLTQFGFDAVKHMNKIGMIVDVSHLSDTGFYDVANISEKPFVASHSNSRVIADVKRNLSDEQFKIICDRKGLVGINFYYNFINPNMEPDIDDLINHIEHFLELGGEDVICMGSDFDGADMPGFIKDITFMYEFYNELVKRNYSEKLIEKLFFENAFNFFLVNLPMK